MAGFEDNMYIVWDVAQSAVLWREDGYEGTPGLYPPLAEWLDNEGQVTIEDGVAGGKYRIFGLECNHPKTMHGGLELLVDLKTKNLSVIDRSRNAVDQVKYEADSGDWAFASFSDDGSVIAVVEPYYVTFFSCSGPEA